MENKNIENYLHLYLGCECSVAGLCEEIDGTQKHIGQFKLTGISFDETQKVWWAYFDGTEFSYCQMDEVKPLLRPLSDMTESEHREIKTIMLEYENLRFKCDERDTIKYTNVFIYDEIREDGTHICTSFSSPDNLPAKSVPWFTKHSFDIFDLIRSGLAIDKNKIDSK